MSGRGDLKHLGKRPLHTVTGNDDAVPLVCAPAFKKFSGQTTLHHAWRCHHHARPNVIKVVHTLKAEANMFSWTFLGAVMVETSYSKQNTTATCARVNSKGLPVVWPVLHQWTRTSVLLDIIKYRNQRKVHFSQHSTILVVNKNKWYLERTIIPIWEYLKAAP